MAETAVDPHDPQNPDPYASQLIGGLEGAPAVQSIEQPTGKREVTPVPRGVLIEGPPPDFGAFTDLVPRQHPPIGGIDFGAFSDLVPRGEETSTTETQKALDETPEQSLPVGAAISAKTGVYTTPTGPTSALPTTPEHVAAMQEPLIKNVPIKIDPNAAWYEKAAGAASNTVAGFVSGMSSGAGIVSILVPPVGLATIPAMVPDLIEKVKEAEKTPANSPERWQAGSDVLGFMATLGAIAHGTKKALTGKETAEAPKAEEASRPAEPEVAEPVANPSEAPTQSEPLPVESVPVQSRAEGTPEYARVNPDIDQVQTESQNAAVKPAFKVGDQIITGEGIHANIENLPEGEVPIPGFVDKDGNFIYKFEEDKPRPEEVVSGAGTPEQAAEAPIVPELTDNSGNVRYRKVEGKWRGTKSDVEITDPEVVRRLDEDYRKQVQMSGSSQKTQAKKIADMTPQEYNAALGKTVFDSLYRYGEPKTKHPFYATDIMASDILGTGGEHQAVHGVQFANPLIAESRYDASQKLLGKNIYSGTKVQHGVSAEAKAILDKDNILGDAAARAGYDAIVTPREVQVIDKSKLPPNERVGYNEQEGYYTDPSGKPLYEGIGLQRAKERTLSETPRTTGIAPEPKVTSTKNVATEAEPLGISQARTESELGAGSVEPGVGAELGSGLNFGRDYINKGGDPRLPIRRAEASGLVGKNEVGIVHAELERLRGERDRAAQAAEANPNDPAAQKALEQADNAQRAWRKELQPVLTKASDALREAYAESTVPDVGSYRGLANLMDEHFKGQRELTPEDRTILQKVSKTVSESRAETIRSVNRVVEATSKRAKKVMSSSELKADLASVLRDAFSDCIL